MSERRHSGAPRPFKRRLHIGDHSRYECLMRPGEWCRGVGGHGGQCRACPLQSRLEKEMTRWRGL